MDDKTLISNLGGPTEVARKLGLDPAGGGTQRVHNWLTRGIPARVKLERPDLFCIQDDKRSVYNVHNSEHSAPLAECCPSEPRHGERRNPQLRDTAGRRKGEAS